MNYPSKIDDWKTSEKNNPTTGFNILYINKKEICPAYISKINSNCEKQINLLMIPNEELKEVGIKRKRITTNSTNPHFIIAMFWTCFFSPFSSLNDGKIKLQGLQ